MRQQNFELKNKKIKDAFSQLKKDHPEKLTRKLALSWSNWGFGIEPLADSVGRLKKYGVDLIELHGNHYGPDLGYKATEVKKLLRDHEMAVSGVCGMFSAENDLSSNRASHRQSAVDYLKREIAFTAEMHGSYLLVVPGAVGRPAAYDQSEFDRSVETLRLVADLFVQYGVRAAIEPVRSAEVSFVHTIGEARQYIAALDHPGIRHINGDVYHMQSEEAHIGESLLEAGALLTNLHMADSNRCALGQGSMDLDTIIMALYIIGFNEEGKFVTPEPLGPGGDPYPAMFNKPDKDQLDRLVADSIHYFRERENVLLMQ